jgi:hypothetical protein
MATGLQRGHLSSTQVSQAGRGGMGTPSAGFTNKLIAGFNIVPRESLSALAGAHGDIGIAIAGGYNTATELYYATMEYIAISTTSNAINYGDLTRNFGSSAGVSSATRGFTVGGMSPDNVHHETMAFSLRSKGVITNGMTFNFTNTPTERKGMCGISSATRGVICSGFNFSFTSEVGMSFITFATFNTYSDFGSLGTARGNSGSVMSTTRGIIVCGETSNNVTTSASEYITIATAGAGTNFGNNNNSIATVGSVSSNTRGVIAGGAITGMSYYTIATTGTGTNFGEHAVAINGPSGTSNGTRGVFTGGRVSSTMQTRMDYITIASTGNTTSFGNLDVARYTAHLGQIAQSHGGI